MENKKCISCRHFSPSFYIENQGFALDNYGRCLIKKYNLTNPFSIFVQVSNYCHDWAEISTDNTIQKLLTNALN